MVEAKIEYRLEVDVPELNSKDILRVEIDLNSQPGLLEIVGNFYRFLTRIGISPEELDEYISFPEDIDDSKEEDLKTAKSSIVSEIERSIINNSTDSKKREDFKKKIHDSPEFLEEVFKTFLKSFIEEEDDKNEV